MVRRISNFNPRPPCGERQYGQVVFLDEIQFQSTPPMRGATYKVVELVVYTYISIHAPHAGSDPFVTVLICPFYPYFNPRPPCGERQISSVCCLFSSNFNPRPPCGERPPDEPICAPFPDISIHAPHAGSDPCIFGYCHFGFKFQSTPPMRGATVDIDILAHKQFNFNPRPPCGERLYSFEEHIKLAEISIHAPHAGSDCLLCPIVEVFLLFQSTPPMRGATSDAVLILFASSISIHAPHAGSDIGTVLVFTSEMLISIHAPPCGERPFGSSMSPRQ